MKVRASIRSLAKQPGSKVVRRRGHTYVIKQEESPASRPVRAEGDHHPRRAGMRLSTHPGPSFPQYRHQSPRIDGTSTTIIPLAP